MRELSKFEEKTRARAAQLHEHQLAERESSLRCLFRWVCRGTFPRPGASCQE